MTSVNVTTTKNTVTVSEGDTRIVTIKTQGPQGPAFSDGDKGDVTVSSNGTAISINNSAVTSAKIADGAIVNADINASAAIALSKLATGALPTAITVTSANISDLSIVDADISGSAAISLSKLATGALPTAITVTSANISDLSIVNADINASAGIQGTKISANFGSQSIISSLDGNQVTQGNAALTLTHATNSNLRANHLIVDDFPSGSGTYFIQATESGVSNDRNMCLQGYGGKLKIGSNSVAPTELLDVAGNIAVSGTVDGRDVAADGTKLDGIETGATADQTASEIKTAYESNSDTNAFTDADHTKLDGIETAATADQTAAEILTLIKTVDGAGSGLDADTLDGISSASFLRSDTNATFSGSTLTVNATLLLSDSIRIGDDAFIEDYNAANSVRIKGNQDTNKGFIAFGQQTKKLGVDGASAALTYDGNTVIDSAYTGALANGITATTQSASDNSTKVATTAYTDTAISNLVNSAPSTLDTLKELSDALGSDPNFATTVTNSIATKLPLAGGTLTGNLTISNNSPRINFTDGNNNDFAIIVDGNDLNIQDTTAGENRLNINSSGVVSCNDGLSVTGTITSTSSISVPDAVSIFLGTGNDLSLKHDGTNSNITNTSGNLNIDGGAHILFTNVHDEDTAKFLANGAVELYYDNSKKFETLSTGAAVSGSLGVGTTTPISDVHISKSFHSPTGGIDSAVALTLSNTTAGQAVGMCLLASAQSVSFIHFGDVNDANIGSIAYNHPSEFMSFTVNAQERMTIDSSGNVNINKDNAILQIGQHQDLQLSHDASNTLIRNNTGELVISCGGSGNANPVKIQPNQGEESIVAHHNERVELYYDGSKKLVTTSYGVAFVDEAKFDNDTNAGRDVIWDPANDQMRWLDNTKATFGTGSDLNIRHDGVRSLIENSTGILKIISGDKIDLCDGNFNTYHARLNSGNSVELYFNNSKKFETKSNGVEITGNVDISGLLSIDDSQKAVFGDSHDLQIYHDGSNSAIQNSTGILYLYGGSDNIRIRPENGEDSIIAKPNERVELYYDNSKKFETISTGAVVTGNLGLNTTSPASTIDARAASGATITARNTGTAASISMNVGSSANILISRGVNSSTARDLIFMQGTTTAAKIDTNNNFLITNDNAMLQFGAGQDLKIAHTGSESYIQNSTGALQLQADDIKLFDHSTAHLYFRGQTNSSVELYFDNSKKLETYANGIKLGDNVLAAFGDDVDLLIHHTGSTGYIKNQTGNFYIQNDGVIIIGNQSASTAGLKFIDGGALELYHNNSKKFETASGGISVVGQVDLTRQNTASEGGEVAFRRANDNTKQWYIDVFGSDNNANLRFHSETGPNGAGRTYAELSFTQFVLNFGLDLNINHVAGKLKFQDYLNIHHNGSNAYFVNTVGNQIFEANSGEKGVEIQTNGSVDLYYDNNLKLNTTSTGTTTTGQSKVRTVTAQNSATEYNGQDFGFLVSYDGGSDTNDEGNGICFAQQYYDQDGSTVRTGAIVGYKSVGNGSFGGGLQFKVQQSGATPLKVALKMDHQGHLYMPHDNQFLKIGAGQDLQLYHDGNDSIITNGIGNLILRNTSGDAGVIGLQPKSGENAIICRDDNNVELYYDNNKKLETTTNGITVTGSVTTQDMNMSNLNGSANEVDNTKGSWSIQEGSDNLFIINRVTGKKYKFNLTEIS